MLAVESTCGDTHGEALVGAFVRSPFDLLLEILKGVRWQRQIVAFTHHPAIQLLAQLAFNQDVASAHTFSNWDSQTRQGAERCDHQTRRAEYWADLRHDRVGNNIGQVKSNGSSEAFSRIPCFNTFDDCSGMASDKSVGSQPSIT